MWFATLALVISSLLLGSIPAANKLCMSMGVSAQSIVFFTFITIFLCSFLAGRMKGIQLRMTGKQAAELALMGILGQGLTGWMLNRAYSLAPVGLVQMLHFLYPTLNMAALSICFHEKFTRRKAAAAALSLLGMAVLAELSGGVNLRGCLLAVASAIFYAYYVLMNDKGSSAEMPLLAKLTVSSGCCAAFFGLWALGTSSLALPDSTLLWLLVVGLAGGGSLIAFALLSFGIKRLGALRAGYLNTIEPIISLLCGLVFFHDPFSARRGLGSALILLSILLIAGQEKRPPERNAKK